MVAGGFGSAPFLAQARGDTGGLNRWLLYLTPTVILLLLVLFLVKSLLARRAPHRRSQPRNRASSCLAPGVALDRVATFYSAAQSPIRKDRFNYGLP